MKEQIQSIYNKQRHFFDAGNTKSYEFRITQLKKLKKMIEIHEDEIVEALYHDLHKPVFEAYTAEIGVMYEEINHTIKHLKSWMKPQRATTPLVFQPSKSRILSQPLGVVLIIGPWNYPFQLLMAPLVGAIAAGNCAIIKPSDQTRHTSNLVKKLVEETFSEEYISVVQGPGAMIGPMLIEALRFDHIFFTGSPSVGSKIAEMTAKHLTPVTLELGGKSPVIVTEDAKLDIAAKRLTWAKFFNTGQTCVCPDYLIVHEAVKVQFVDRMKHYIREFFGDDPLKSDSYGRIVNEKRFDILSNYLKEGKIIIGGRTNRQELYIEPTLIEEITFENRMMQEEIFGPILPVLTYRDLSEVVEMVRKNRYPLALYLYTENKKTEEYIINHIEFGGGCINNGMVHVANTHLPFGGVGNSGMGRYHGKYSFDLFSHKKSIISSKTFFDQSLTYAPYNNKKLSLAKKYFRKKFFRKD